MKCPVCKTEIEPTIKKCPTCGFTDLYVDFVSTDDAASWVEQVVIPYRKEWEKNCYNADDLYRTMQKRQLSRIMSNSESKDSPFEFELDENGAILTQYNGSNEAIQIPDYYNDVPVYKIADRVFQNCLELKHVELPTHLQIIGKSAFAGSSIVDISLNDELIEICGGAFINTSLNEVVIPDSVKRIGTSAFEFRSLFNKSVKCTTNIKLGRNVEHIGDRAFIGTATTKLIFPETLKTIPSSVCAICQELTTVVILGANKICSSAFNGCVALKEIMLPDCLETVDTHAFNSCSNLRSIVLPENTTSLALNFISNALGYNKSTEPVKIAFLSDNVRIIPPNKIDNFHPEWVTFYCNSGSSAQKYAREHRIQCYPLSEFVED